MVVVGSWAALGMVSGMGRAAPSVVLRPPVSGSRCPASVIMLDDDGPGTDVAPSPAAWAASSSWESRSWGGVSGVVPVCLSVGASRLAGLGVGLRIPSRPWEPLRAC